VKPLMDKFYNYISQISQPIGQLRKAIQNAIQLKSRVYHVFEKNGQLPLSNNSVEQSIRPSTLIRKNCLFAKTEEGAKANAVYYSLVETAKLNQ
ncbi:IS66 family transposase, partial [Limosilactobacillus reuteri]